MDIIDEIINDEVSCRLGGYLYQGEIYCNGRPHTLGPPEDKAFWPKPIRSPKYVRKWPGEGYLEFELSGGLAVPKIEFIRIDEI